MIIAKTVLLAYILCELPEDDEFTETCRRNLILKYTIYRLEHLLALIESVIRLEIHGMNNAKAVRRKLVC
jgi:hypothetical protein